ncbi:hypothetical protein LTR08_007092 [Meristemomyces frigidus]|nr:hypothetical protein LTR08_007092 [Meristemomyces frigidus]
MGQDQSIPSRGHTGAAPGNDEAHANGIVTQGTAAREPAGDQASDGVAIRGTVSENHHGDLSTARLKDAATKDLHITTKASRGTSATPVDSPHSRHKSVVVTPERDVSETPHVKIPLKRKREQPEQVKHASTQPETPARLNSTRGYGRADFNGLRAVPTGPKTPIPESDWRDPQIPNLQDVNPIIRAEPHAFVSRQWLPPSQSTVRHVKGYLQRYDPKGVYVDDSGFYITFPDTEKGHRKLDVLVAEAPAMEMLFAMYTLHMEAFHDGQPASEQTASIQPPIGGGLGEVDKTQVAGATIDWQHDDFLDYFAPQTSRGTSKSNVQNEMELPNPSSGGVDVASSPASTGDRPAKRPKVSTSGDSLPPFPGLSADDRPTKSSVAYADNGLVAAGTANTSLARRITDCNGVNSSSLLQSATKIKETALVEPQSHMSAMAGQPVATLPKSTKALNHGMAKDIYSKSRTRDRDSLFLSDKGSEERLPKPSGSHDGEKQYPGSKDPLLDAAMKLVDESFPETSHGGTVAPPVMSKPSKLLHLRRKIVPTQQSSVPRPVSQAPTALETGAPSQSCKERTVQPSTELKSPLAAAVVSAHPGADPDLSGSADPSRQSEGRQHRASTNVLGRWGPEVVHYYEWHTRGLRYSELLVQLSALLPQWTDVVDILNCVIWRSADKGNQRRDILQPSTRVTHGDIKNCIDFLKAQPVRHPSHQWPGAADLLEHRSSITFDDHGVICDFGPIPYSSSKAPVVSSYRASDKVQTSELITEGLVVPEVPESPAELHTKKSADTTSSKPPRSALAPKPERARKDQAANDGRALLEEPPLRHADIAMSATAISANDRSGDVGRTKNGDPPDDVLEASLATSPLSDISSDQLSDTFTDPEPSVTPDRTSTSITEKKKRPRKSYTGGTGLGDSKERPEGTYMRLIAMALSEAPSRQLQMGGLCHWIADNISGYDFKEAKWKSGISTTISAHTGPKGKRLFLSVPWKVGDDVQNGKAAWYKLRAGLADALERWDPVLKQPVSPLQGLRSHDSAKEIDGEAEQNKVATQSEPEQHAKDCEVNSSQAVRDRCAKARAGRKRKRRLLASLKDSDADDQPDPMELDTPAALDESGKAADTNSATDVDGLSTVFAYPNPTDSSDDEPLASVQQKKSKTFVAPAAMMHPPPSPLEEEEAHEDHMEVDTPHAAATKPASGATNQRSHLQQSDRVQASSSGLGQPIKPKAKDTDYAARSLFVEWPQYDPKNYFDKVAMVAEIKKRPTRKDMFKKAAMYSRLGSNESAELLQDLGASASNVPRDSAERTSKVARKQPSFDAFSLEDKVQHCETLEEFVGLPANPIPFMDKGQLAYRDGTRDENGKLPRVKYKYATG